MANNVDEAIQFLNIFENYAVLWDVKEKEYLKKNLKRTVFFSLLTFPSLEFVSDEQRYRIKRPYEVILMTF
jgi:hypothetical protein